MRIVHDTFATATAFDGRTATSGQVWHAESTPDGTSVQRSNGDGTADFALTTDVPNTLFRINTGIYDDYSVSVGVKRRSRSDGDFEFILACRGPSTLGISGDGIYFQITSDATNPTTKVAVFGSAFHGASSDDLLDLTGATAVAWAENATKVVKIVVANQTISIYFDGVLLGSGTVVNSTALKSAAYSYVGIVGNPTNVTDPGNATDGFPTRFVAPFDVFSTLSNPTIKIGGATVGAALYPGTKLQITGEAEHTVTGTAGVPYVADSGGKWSAVAITPDGAASLVGDEVVVFTDTPPVVIPATNPGGAAGYGIVRALLGWQAVGVLSPLLAIGAHAGIWTFNAGTLTDRTPATGFVAAGPDTVYGSSGGQYGAGAYGVGPYGVGDATQATVTEAGVWSLDVFGNYLLGVLVPSDGKLYVWDGSVAAMRTIAQFASDHSLTVTGTPPTSNVGVVVTPERFAIALGANGDPRACQWPSRETLHDWVVLDTTTAGTINLPGQGSIMCGRAGRNETLIWTTEDLFSLQYIGGQLVYARTKLGSACGIISRNACAVVDGKAVWMGHKSFFVYDGFVKPVPSEVSDYVFSNFNFNQAAKCFARTISDLGEVHFHYCSALANEPDLYVIWNYREDHWTPGSTTRSAGIDRGAFSYPICADQQTLYEHERGNLHPGADAPFLESGPIELGSGDNVMDVLELIPDEATQAGQVLGSLQATLYGAIYPDATERVIGPFSLASNTSVRLQARTVRVRYDEVVPGEWRLGVPRLNVTPGGQR